MHFDQGTEFSHSESNALCAPAAKKLLRRKWLESWMIKSKSDGLPKEKTVPIGGLKKTTLFQARNGGSL